MIGAISLFSEASRGKLANQMGIKLLTVSTMQSAIRTLQRKHIIGSAPERGRYYIDDPNFKRWLESIIVDENKSFSIYTQSD